MSNISTASGIISLPKDFYRKNKTLIKAAKPQSQDYGIELISGPLTYDESNEVSWDFSGNGKWSMDKTFEWCLTKTIAGQKLAQKMSEHNVTFTVEYYDYEPGCEFLVEGNGTLIPKKEIINNEEKWVMDVNVAEHYLEYTDYNKIKLEFEDGITIGHNTKTNINMLLTDDKLCELYQKNKHALNMTYKEFIINMEKLIKNDPELDNGLCDFRLEQWIDDSEEFLDIFDIWWTSNYVSN